MLYFLQIFISCSSRSTPFPPISLKPAEIIINPFTPFLPHSSAASFTNLPGIAKIAISISSGTFNTLSKHGRSQIILALGFIG